MKRTILLGSLILSAGLTLTQTLSLSRNSSESSLNQPTHNSEVIVYEGTDEDGNREEVPTATTSS